MFKRVNDFRTATIADLRSASHTPDTARALTLFNDLTGVIMGMAQAASRPFGENPEPHPGPTRSLHPLVEEGLAITKQLDTIMQSRYAANAARIGEWTRASRIAHAQHGATAKAA